jgi:hypothetical protein
MLSVTFSYYYAECHYAVCRYAECRGTHHSSLVVMYFPLKVSSWLSLSSHVPIPINIGICHYVRPVILLCYD